MLRLYTHPACLRHDNGPDHPESPARLTAILRALDHDRFWRDGRLRNAYLAGTPANPLKLGGWWAKKQNRWVVHLLHYVAERKCATLDIIDNMLPLYQLSITMIVPRNVQRVALVPEDETIPFTQAENQLNFTVPEICGHRMLAIEFMTY